jgi:SAM-dependent methyltransferase
MQKKLNAYGIASLDFPNIEMAKAYTYDDAQGTFPPTPLIFDENPFNHEIANAKNILEVGCGVGRNLKWTIENGLAKYYGIEPNPSMMKYFSIQNKDLPADRFEIHSSFETLPQIKFDVIFFTFVLQHITYRPENESMHVDHIIQKCFEFASDNTVFLLIEHEQEEPGWLEKWFKNNDILPDVYIRDWTRKGRCSVPSVTDRGSHDLIIFKKKF